jgi:hypothetical protein
MRLEADLCREHEANQSLLAQTRSRALVDSRPQPLQPRARGEEGYLRLDGSSERERLRLEIAGIKAQAMLIEEEQRRSMAKPVSSASRQPATSAKTARSGISPEVARRRPRPTGSVSQSEQPPVVPRRRSKKTQEALAPTATAPETLVRSPGISFIDQAQTTPSLIAGCGLTVRVVFDTVGAALSGYDGRPCFFGARILIRCNGSGGPAGA